MEERPQVRTLHLTNGSSRLGGSGSIAALAALDGLKWSSEADVARDAPPRYLGWRELNDESSEVKKRKKAHRQWEE